MKRFRIFAATSSLLLCALLGLEGRARACSCTGVLPPNQEMAEANAVFTGKVIKLTKIGVWQEHPEEFKGYDVTIELATVIKGKTLKNKAGKKVTIFTGSGWGDCGYEFQEGQQYLIYAFEGKSSLATNICTRTKLLKGAENELLELEGRLPKIAVASHPPELVLRGTIDDAGYQGYVFDLHNQLHGRIFYGPLMVQVFRDGKWVDYPFNTQLGPREEPTAAQAAKMLSMEQLQAAYLEAERIGLRGAQYLSRMSKETFFAALQSRSLPWRVGCRYATEQEMSTGKKLSNAGRIVWSPQIDASIQPKKLTFEGALKNTGMIPNPLGTSTGEN